MESEPTTPIKRQSTTIRSRWSQATTLTLSYDRDEYVVWGFSARREKFGLPENLEAVDGKKFSEGILARAFMKIFFRTLDLIPPLKVAFHRLGK